ncbi:MAG: DUF4292 domain-containing protein [Bacteroidales bacterium]|nr:DUF4292 domain-containing protein [Bacteroidales bacterium]
MTKKRYKSKIYALALCMACGIAMVSCSSSKNQVAVTNTVPDAAGSGVVHQQPVQSQKEWSDVQIPVRVSLAKPMKVSLSGRATLLRDSVINISIRVLGMEVAVINITSDSVVMADKFHKYLFAEPLATVLGSHKMTVGQMQDIMLGTELGEVTEMTFSNPGNPEPVKVSFSDFATVPAGTMAQIVTVTAPVNKKEVEASVIWSADRARWDTGARVNFRTPVSGYKRVTVSNALKMLESF